MQQFYWFEWEIIGGGEEQLCSLRSRSPYIIVKYIVEINPKNRIKRQSTLAIDHSRLRALEIVEAKHKQYN